MFPEAQPHRTACTRWLTEGGITIPMGGQLLGKEDRYRGRTGKGGWGNTVHGKGRPKCFFFFLRKDGFVWKKMLPSSDIEKLPSTGFDFLQNNMQINVPKFLHFLLIF